MSGTVPDKGAFLGGGVWFVCLEQKTGREGREKVEDVCVNCGICLKGMFLKAE